MIPKMTRKMKRVGVLLLRNKLSVVWVKSVFLFGLLPRLYCVIKITELA